MTGLFFYKGYCALIYNENYTKTSERCSGKIKLTTLVGIDGLSRSSPVSAT